jgi:predicted RNase H-like HicB family nuclease
MRKSTAEASGPGAIGELMMSRKYLVIIEKVGDNFNAYAPDLPGCAVCGDTREETQHLIQEAINLYVQGMLEKRALGRGLTASGLSSCLNVFGNGRRLGDFQAVFPHAVDLHPFLKQGPVERCPPI